MEIYMDSATVNIDDNINWPQVWTELCENGPLDDFLIWAKEYNIFQVSRSTLYDEMCEKIRTRMNKEGLDPETLRTE